MNLAPLAADFVSLNAQTRTLSRESLYRLIDKAVPGVPPSFQDNEDQIAKEVPVPFK